MSEQQRPRINTSPEYAPQPEFEGNDQMSPLVRLGAAILLFAANPRALDQEVSQLAFDPRLSLNELELLEHNKEINLSLSA